MCASLRLEKFCCCCSVRTGCLVIATAGWILTLIETLGLITTIRTSTTTESTTKNQTDTGKDSLDKFFEDDGEEGDYGFEIGYAVVTLLICALLTWGVYKRDNRFMLPWLVLKGIENVLGLVAVFFILVFGAFFVHEGGWIFVVFALVLLAVFGLFWYFWICVWSHYKELSEGTVPPVYYSPTTEHTYSPQQKGSQMV